MLYSCRDYKNVTRDKKLLWSRSFVCFWGFANSLLKYKKFFRLGARKIHFTKYEKLFKSKLFLFFGLGSSLLKYNKFFRVSVSRNTRKCRFLKYTEFFRGFRFPINKKSFLLRKYRKFLRGLRFLKYNKSFLLRKYKKFFNIRDRFFRSIRNFLGVDFFIF